MAKHKHDAFNRKPFKSWKEAAELMEEILTDIDDPEKQLSITLLRLAGFTFRLQQTEEQMRREKRRR